MVIYCISGLGADYRAFSKLSIDAELIHLPWKTPQPKESIEHYAARMADEIDSTQPFILMGLSFGGLIAMEIAKILNPVKVILISSVETRNDMPLLYRAIGYCNFFKIIPLKWFKPPKRLIKYLFGTTSTDVLYPILDDTDLWFTKWALSSLVTWQNKTRLSQTIKINGTSDRLFRPSKQGYTISITKGHHFMIVDHSMAISDHINDIIKTQPS